MEAIKAIVVATLDAIILELKKYIGFQSVCFTAHGRVWIKYHWSYKDALESVRLNAPCARRAVIANAAGIVVFEVAKVKKM